MAMAIHHGNSLPPLSQPGPVLSDIKAELRSELHTIEALLDTILKRQSALLSKLQQLDKQEDPSDNPADSSTALLREAFAEPLPQPSPTGLPSPKWSDVVRKKPRRAKVGNGMGRPGRGSQSPAVGDPFDASILSANFSRLPDKLTLAHTEELVASASKAAVSQAAASQVATTSSVAARSSPLHTNVTSITPVRSSSSKRPFPPSISPHTSTGKRCRRISPKSNTDPIDHSPMLDTPVSVVVRGSDVIADPSLLGSPPASQSRMDSAPPAALEVQTPNEDLQANGEPTTQDLPAQGKKALLIDPPCASVFDSTKLASLVCSVRISPKLSTYMLNGTGTNPGLLIVGDSIVRHLVLPGAITYCLSGGKVDELTVLIPSLLEKHPTVSSVLVHVGSNDVMARQSAKLYSDFVSLGVTIESLGKRCILSGPIPQCSLHSEHFSRVFSLHSWLHNLCTSTGRDCIPNFDSFWSDRSLYRKDCLHLNNKGTKLLSDNFIQYIAFNLS